MRWLTYSIVLWLLVGCTATVHVRSNRAVVTDQPIHCDLYVPAEREVPPVPIPIDALGLASPEAVALLLAGEVRALRDYIERRDNRAVAAMARYRATCIDRSKDSQPGPN